MDSFFEQFINGVYQEAQQTLSYLFGYPPYRCTIIKFGGFCYSHKLTVIVQQWQAIEIGGFRPFWYFIGLGLLTVFGFFLRGLLFSGAGGEGISKLGKLSNSKKDNGSKVVIIKK